MKSYQTTDAHFRAFRKAFEEAAESLPGVNDFDITFHHAYIEDAFAQIGFCTRKMSASVSFATNFEGRKPTREFIQGCARHEALHLFLAPLHGLAFQRFLSEVELERAIETMVRRTGKLLNWEDV